MKQLTCEMCGSNDLLKQDGVFVCQTCGTKYSVEEAKKMMVEGTVEVSSTVKVDQSHLIENFLDMASSAITSGNHSEAEQYCNKVIEIDSNNYKAFLYKGTAAAWQSTFAKLRILETINCWKNAFNNCDKENEKELISYTDSEFRNIVIAMVNKAGSFIEDGINDYNGKLYGEHLLSILKCVKLYTTSINSAFCGEDICCEAAISVIPSLMKCAQSEERLYHKIQPSSAESYEDFIKEYLGCIYVINTTATFGQKDKAKALCYEKAAEVMQTINDLPFYIWSNGRYEPRKNPTNSYRSTVAEYKEKAAEARGRIAKEENNQRRAEFWSKHSEEYKILTQELSKAKQKRDELTKAQKIHGTVKLLDKHISDITAILEEDRNPTSQLKKTEKDFIKNCDAFWNELSSNDEYDIYLDQNPILKKADSLAKKRETLLEKKRYIGNTQDLPSRRALKVAARVTILGVLLSIIGVFAMNSWLFLCMPIGILFVIGGVTSSILFMIRYAADKARVRSEEDTYKKDVRKYNATVEKMQAVPKYTGNVSHNVEVKIPLKIDEN